MTLSAEKEKKFCGYLAEFVLPDRLAKLRQTLDERTRYLTIILEDIYQGHNMSAVLRSCDAFGVQDVHVFEKRNAMKVTTDIAMGTEKWLSLHKEGQANNRTIDESLSELKKKGYRLVCTTPDPTKFKDRTYSIRDLPLDQPIALVFGTEKEGLTEEALKMADIFLSVPMHGFVESLNISVCAAICLFELSHRLRAENTPWKLSETEKNSILWRWLIRDICRHDKSMAKNYFKRCFENDLDVSLDEIF